MKKKSGGQHLKEKDMIFGIKWELYRRNRHYIKDYNEYIASCRDIKESDVSSDLKKKQTELFKRKYRIRIPLDPKVSFLELKESLRKPIKEALEDDWKKMREDIKEFDKREKIYHQVVLKNNARYKKHLPLVNLPLKPEKLNYLSGKYKAILLETITRNFIDNGSAIISLNEIDSKQDIVEQFNESLNYKTIKITLNLNNSVQKIINDLGWMIKVWHQIRDEKKDKNKRRLRLFECIRYIEVQSLKEKGISLKKIAEKYYKNDIDRGELNYAKRKVKRDLERFKRLQEESDRQIR